MVHKINSDVLCIMCGKSVSCDLELLEPGLEPGSGGTPQQRFRKIPKEGHWLNKEGEDEPVMFTCDDCWNKNKGPDHEI